MKKLFLLTVLAVFGLSFTTQTNTDGIVQAFKSGNADQVAAYFDEYVDLKLLDKDEVKNMSRNQASIALKSFFTENAVKGFEKASEREIGNTMYMTGKMSNGGKGFNVTIMLKQTGGKLQIITVRIN